MKIPVRLKQLKIEPVDYDSRYVVMNITLIAETGEAIKVWEDVRASVGDTIQIDFEVEEEERCHTTGHWDTWLQKLPYFVGSA